MLNKEKEKSFLPDFSSDVAAVRTKEELTVQFILQFKNQIQKSGFAILRINEDNTTMSAYIFDLASITFEFRQIPLQVVK